MAEQEEWSLDSIFETALENSQASSRTDAIVVAIHACLIADRFHLVAIGDEVFYDRQTLYYYSIWCPFNNM